MTARTCEDLKHVKDIGETTKFNQYVLKNGLMEVAQKYVPQYWDDDYLGNDIDDAILQEFLAQEDHASFEEMPPIDLDGNELPVSAI